MDEFFIDWGNIEICLNEYLINHNISRSSLARKAQLQYSQILNYCNKTVQKLDINVLARICCVLNCNLSDIAIYIPAKR